MQSSGAEMLRVACVLGDARGVDIIAPVHDAVLIQAPAGRIDDAVRVMASAMVDAGNIVLADPELQMRVEVAQVVRDGERYFDKRGEEMWNRIQAVIHGSARG